MRLSKKIITIDGEKVYQKEVFIIRTNNDRNGNPKYLIDTSLFPELKGIGKPKRKTPWIETISSYNIEQKIKEKIKNAKILISKI